MEKNVYYEQENSSKQPAVAVIGLGNMGKAMVSGLLQSEVTVIVSNHDAEKTQAKVEEAGIDKASVKIAQSNREAVGTAEMIFVSLKQAQMEQELKQWAAEGVLTPEQVVISLAAGVRSTTIQRWLGNERQPVVRIMPNTPLASGRGVLGWYITGSSFVEQEEKVRKLLEKIGTVYQVEQEEDLDIITALTGSAPAFYYAVTEIFAFWGHGKGLKKEVAELLAREAFIGAAIHADKTGESVSALRRKVTSKGGTTEAGLSVFGQNNLFGVLCSGLEAARERAAELGLQFDRT